MKKPIVLALALSLIGWCWDRPLRAQWSRGDHEIEKLDRGVIAIPVDGQRVFISWRLLATESPTTAFHLYRQVGSKPPVKLNPSPLTGPTCFVDDHFDPTTSVDYLVKTEEETLDQAFKSKFTLKGTQSKNYLSIPIRAPEGYHANDCAPGDLDGDGQYELIVHMVGRGRDNSRGGVSSEPIFHAYKLDGTLLWTIQLGKNIREGAHYTQFLVYDFDGNGKSELVCKTADGTIDGVGKAIGDPHADHRIQEGPRVGIILSGPEYLTVFDGLTGAAIDTQPYVPPRGGAGEQWGDKTAIASIAFSHAQRTWME